MSGACSILQGNEEAKPAEQVTESKGTVDAFKSASTAHPVPATEDGMDNDQTGMAADVAPAASTDVPTGVHADKAAAAHLAERTGTKYLFQLDFAACAVVTTWHACRGLQGYKASSRHSCPISNA